MVGGGGGGGRGGGGLFERGQKIACKRGKKKKALCKIQRERTGL